MEPAYRGIEEETVTRLPSKAFDEFLKALDRPVVFRQVGVSCLVMYFFRV